MWIVKIPNWAKFDSEYEYLSDPSADLIGTFKEEIINYDDPKDHPSYVKCDNVEESEGNLLFILFGRVEIMVRPDNKTNKIYFLHCEDV